ncbi:hypothetical protein Mal4_11320 [Maioricimonas rarisocia]|uniref:Uncharacterized protein n=1 Tax=Maioricimonas rarisocia TaxID=2528026 RepID=A0A517Z2Z4_9PLAN|nr:hypothetical protein [Maioricimonas rarisocia]QDU36833.1 hypothetical protein Mal4_11320 [Maioricimonas rarisocia]
MKTHSTLLALALVTAGFVPNSARADHRIFRQLDNLTFSAMADAREARWIIHDDLTFSREYERVLREADTVVTSLQDVQRSILRERSMATLCRQVDDVQYHVEHLIDRLQRCGFECEVGHVHGRRHPRYAFSGQVHGRHGAWEQDLRRHIVRMRRTLSQLHDLVHGHEHAVLPATPATPASPPILRDRDRGRGGAPLRGTTPGGPILTPPAVPTRSGSPSVRIPLGDGSLGSLTFRLGG